MNTITKDIYNGFTPLPEDLRGWNGDRAIFGELIEETRPRQIIEVGTWKGLSAITMAGHVKRLGLECRITCVDTWLGAEEFWISLSHTPERDLMLRHGYPQVYYQFLSNVVHREMQDIILPLPLPSRTAAKVLSAKRVVADLVYIDGSHEPYDVMDDCESYWPLLREDGIMFGDDWCWEGMPDTVSQFSRCARAHMDVRDNFWILRKL